MLARAVDRALGVVGLTRAPRGAQASVFNGAVVNRLTGDFMAGLLSPDQESRTDLRKLRDRARKLERDNAYAARYVSLVEENVVGPDGYGLQLDLEQLGEAPDDGADASPATAATAARAGQGSLGELVEAAWLDFTRREHCSVDGRSSFTDLESLAARRWMGADGEAFVQIVPGRGKYGVQFEALDADLLDEHFHRAAGRDGNEIRSGVEVETGTARPVAYHFFTRHPAESGSLTITRKPPRRAVPAELVVHLFDLRRAGQVRGITRYAPVMMDLHRLGALQEAVLIQQHVAACQMAVIVQKEQDAMPLSNDPDAQSIPQEAEPAKMPVLPYGYGVEAFEPGMPGEQYTPFTTDVKHAIAAGLGVSHMSLTGNVSSANYSSARVGLKAEQRRWMRDQQRFRDAFHVPLFRAWLRYAALEGALPIALTDIARLEAAALWLLPGWDFIDPTKDADAAITEVDATMDSLTNILARKGRDFPTIARQRAREVKLLRRLGLPETPTPRPSPATAPGAPAPAIEADDA